MIIHVNPPLLTEENWPIYTAQHYRNTQCASMDEFNEDIRRIKYLKKLCTRFETTGELKTRLILNHLVVLNNVFLPEPFNRILFLKTEPQFGLIKPFLLTLSVLSDKIINVKTHRIVDTSSIAMNPIIINNLREILPGKRLDE
jgi:hypothetical protein